MKADPTFSDVDGPTVASEEAAFPLQTPTGAGQLLGWVRGLGSVPTPLPTDGISDPKMFVLTGEDGSLFDGQLSGFLSAETGNGICLWSEAGQVVGRECSGPASTTPDPHGVVVFTFGLAQDGRIVFGCYKRFRHPKASGSQMSDLIAGLVRITEIPAPKRESEPAPTSGSRALGSETISVDVGAKASSPEPAGTVDRNPPSLETLDLSEGPRLPATPVRPHAPEGEQATFLERLGLRSKRGSTTNAAKSIRGHLRLALAAVVLLGGGICGWAATTELNGAVIAMGQLVVDTNVKKVQHPFGGVITELAVRDGDRVDAGDVLVRLDGTETRANLAIVTKGLDELYALQARDEALRDAASSVAFPPELMARAEDPVVAELIKGETRLFETMVSAANGQKAQLREQVSQLEEQTRGMVKQLEAKAKEIDWSARELVGIRDLWRQKLVDFARVTTAERDAAQLEGEYGALQSSIAETKGKIAELELRILQVDEDMRTQVGKELSEARGKIAELVEKKVAAEDRLKRLDIRSPQGGVVHELEFHTVGGVIQPGATIMGVVPDSDALTAEIRVAPQEIDQISVGQKAILRFLTFNQQTTPELNAELTVVSADVTTDPKTGAIYYTARVKVADEDTGQLKGLRLMAGMPVEVFVQTKPRTVASYLMRPIQDQVERAFRER